VIDEQNVKRLEYIATQVILPAIARDPTEDGQSAAGRLRTTSPFRKNVIITLSWVAVFYDAVVGFFNQAVPRLVSL
jgi:hypothetical protein